MPDKKTLQIFGIIWALIFFVTGYKYNLSLFFLSVSLCFLVSAVFYPNIFFKIRIFQFWIKIGDFLGKINSKIITWILFFGIFTPMSFVLKILGKDLLNKKFNKETNSYFIARKIQAGSMSNQF